MRFTAIYAAIGCFFLSLGIVQADNVPARGRKVEPTTPPSENSPIQCVTTTFSGTIKDPVQAVPAQGAVKIGVGTFTLQAQAVPAQVQVQAVPAPTATLTIVAGNPPGGAVPGAVLSVDVLGTRQSQNEEYGLKVKITDDPKKGIKIEQTTHKGGTDETKSYEAKNAQELENKSPEAFKLYQKYPGNQVTVGGGVILGGITNTLRNCPKISVTSLR